VTGATGTVGRDVTRLLSKRSAPVRAGVRDHAKAMKQFGNDVELATFDFENEETFAAALNGVTKVFLLPPLLPNQLKLMNRFVDSAKRAGVRHIVKLSAIGIDDSAQYTVGQWHAANEQHIRESGLAFTFLRPNSFMQNFITYFAPRNGAIHLPWGKGTASFVDTRDVARVAAEALIAEKHAGKIYTLTGPTALGIAEVARILSQAAGQEINYVDVPENAARDGMRQAGVPEWLIEVIMELHAINKQNRWSIVTSDIEKVTGAAATPFGQFARDRAENFRAAQGRPVPLL
jgi:uncharacterized protein YbjT (DUF2867 family)